MADQLFPFLLNESPVRGRVVRLNSSVDTILRRHNYPDVVSRLLAEAVTLCAILSSNLKTDGIVTLQIQSKGTISLLVADATASGGVRGYADFDHAAELEQQAFSRLFEDGHLAITLDAGEGSQRYQGIVALEGKSITDCLQRYFVQSQQLDVLCQVAVGQQIMNGQNQWVAGGMYIEHLPEEKEGESERWNEATALFNTVRDDELLDATLAPPELLHRLFHENGVWVYESAAIEVGCRCSAERISGVLTNMSEQERADMVEDGKISVTCQFCAKAFEFRLEEF